VSTYTDLVAERDRVWDDLSGHLISFWPGGSSAGHQIDRSTFEESMTKFTKAKGAVELYVREIAGSRLEEH